MRPRLGADPLPLDTDPGRSDGSVRALIQRSVLAAIVEGRLPPGARLPSARQLARDWRVSRNTVDDAIGALQAEGLVERRVGAGTFVAPGATLRGRRAAPKLRQPAPFAQQALAQLSRWSAAVVVTHAPDAWPRPQAFVAGLPDLERFPHDLWRRLVARRLRISARPLSGYLPSLGLPALQQAISRHLALARGLACDPAQVLVVNSAMQAADLIARVLLDRGDQVWLEDPALPNLRAALAISGARLVPVPVDEQGIDVAAGMERAPDAALVYVTPTCQFPLGVALSPERRRALLDWAARARAWIVEDDYQGEFVHDRRPPAPLASLDRSGRVLHVGSFSNAVFPSLRLAYVVLPEALVGVFAAVRAQLDDHTHGLGQAVLADFIDGGYYASHLRRMRDVYRSRRDALASAFDAALERDVKLGSMRAGMHATLLMPSIRADGGVAARVAIAGVAALPLSRYAIGRPRWRGLLLGYAALDERAIERGVARLARALRGGA